MSAPLPRARAIPRPPQLVTYNCNAVVVDVGLFVQLLLCASVSRPSFVLLPVVNTPAEEGRLWMIRTELSVFVLVVFRSVLGRPVEK